MQSNSVTLVLSILGLIVPFWMLFYATGMYLQELKSMKKVTLLKSFTFNIIWMVCGFFGSIPSILYRLLGQTEKSRESAHYFGIKMANLLQFVCFQPSIIQGEENIPNKPCVFVANHQSTADIAVMYWLNRKFSWVSKSSVFTVPGVGLLMYMAQYVSLKRSSKESGVKMIEDCRENCLSKGWSVVIFPQGTRRRHKILDFKKGAFRLAQESNVPIVPVTIELPENMYSYGCKDKPRIAFHKPIFPEDEIFKDRDAMLKHCFDTIIGNLSYGTEMLEKQNLEAKNDSLEKKIK